jgi:hypothetical protein
MDGELDKLCNKIYFYKIYILKIKKIFNDNIIMRQSSFII